MDPRITFTRASTATYYGTQTAVAEQNLLVQSQVNNAGWNTTNTTLADNTQVAPDGTTTAATLTDNATSGSHISNQVPAPVLLAGTDYTLSLYMKAGTNNFGVLTLTNATTAQNGISAVIDLSSGVITQIGSGTNATAGLFFAEGVGSGWYRVVITGSSVAGFNRAEFGLAPAATGNTFSSIQRISYSGTGTSIYIWGAQLEQRNAVTAYTPTTTAPITNYIPVLETAAINAPRFDYEPTTQTALGLLIEEQRTNLLTYSEQFDNAAWTKTRSSITANIVVAPDGAITGDKLVEDTTASATHQIQRSVSYTSGTTYTRTLYAKSAERTGFRFQFPSSAFTSALNAYFDLLTGTVAAVSSGVTASITPVGNGWYRCTATATATATASGTEISCGLTITAANPTYTGDGVSGLYIWGAQLEAGAFVTSYIQTVASQVTRSADVAVMTGTNFSTWYNATEGTFFAQFRPLTSNFGGNRNIFLATDNSTANFVGLRYVTSGTVPGFGVTAAGATQASLSTGTMVAGTSYQLAGAYKVNDFAVSRNGGTVVTDTSGTLPVVNRAEIGCLVGINIGSQHIAKLVYYPRRLSNAELQAITA